MSNTKKIGDFIQNHWRSISIVIVLLIVIIVLSVVIGTTKCPPQPNCTDLLTENTDLKTKLAAAKARDSIMDKGCKVLVDLDVDKKSDDT